MKKIFYSISEVSEILGESASLVRFWSNTFPRFVKPVRNAKGNRQFREEDVDVLKKIHFLVNEKGMTLEGVAKTLSSESCNVDATIKALESLREIKSQLLEIRKSL